MVAIDQQMEGKLILLLEGPVGGGIVVADAQDHGVLSLKLRGMIPKVLGFDRATRGVVLGIKIEDHGLAAKLLEGDGFPLVVDGGEVGRRIPYLERSRFRAKRNQHREQSS